MNTARGAARTEPPIACSLGPEDGPERMRRWQALQEKGRASVRRSGHRLEVRYAPAPGVRDELEALAAAERKCCAFVAWEVRQDAGQPILHVTANSSTPDALASISALFGAG